MRVPRGVKFGLAAACAVGAIGYTGFRLYVPHTTTSAVSKFGFAGRAALRSGGKVMCRRVFEPDSQQVANLEDAGLPVPPTTYSAWIEIKGWLRERVRTELSENAERFVNFATACRFHPDIEVMVEDAAGVPAITLELCYSCDKWRADSGTHGGFAKDSILKKLIARNVDAPGWTRPNDPPPDEAIKCFGAEAAAALMNTVTEFRIRRVFAPSWQEMSERSMNGLPPREHVYSEWVQLNPVQVPIVRTALLAEFSVWGEWSIACKPRWDFEIEWLDESCKRMGLVTLCHTCGMWYGNDNGGMFYGNTAKGIMIEAFSDAAEMFKHSRHINDL